MRQRNIKNLDARFAENSGHLADRPQEIKGSWLRYFGRKGPLYLEIGCGKGQFILAMAEMNPQANYIGAEGQKNVMLRTMEKVEDAGADNIRLFIGFVDDLRDYFEEGELDGIYLNFSDPWPKARHAKRRLTYYRRLVNYFQVLKPEGFIEFRTDNDDLFEFTLEQMEDADLAADELTRDLHGSQCAFDSRLITSEYEDKFSAEGKNINYVKMVKKANFTQKVNL